MKHLDFLSGSPNIYIFGKSKSNTTFGGALFLIYIIIIIIIVIAYLLDYFLNDKYIIKTNSYTDYEYEKKNNYKIEPKVNISFDLTDFYTKPLNERFHLYDKNGRKLERNTTYSFNVSDLMISIKYECEDENCIINSPDSFRLFSLLIVYEAFQIDHQGKIPLKKGDSGLSKHYFFSCK